jgi:hypothetical protein
MNIWEESSLQLVEAHSTKTARTSARKAGKEEIPALLHKHAWRAFLAAIVSAASRRVASLCPVFAVSFGLHRLEYHDRRMPFGDDEPMKETEHAYMQRGNSALWGFLGKTLSHLYLDSGYQCAIILLCLRWRVCVPSSISFSRDPIEYETGFRYQCAITLLSLVGWLFVPSPVSFLWQDPASYEYGFQISLYKKQLLSSRKSRIPSLVPPHDCTRIVSSWPWASTRKRHRKAHRDALQVARRGFSPRPPCSRRTRIAPIGMRVDPTNITVR